jgi:outer membrane protein TolC
MTRFEGVKQSYLLGDEPAIDTLEAFIQVQNRQINLNQSDLEYKNATLELSNYLWYENNTPLVITDSLKPPQLANLIDLGIIPLDTLNTLLASLGNDHPELQLYDYKLAGIDIEKRLNTESLKPTINLKYNTLVETGGNNEAINFSNQNYYWGVEFGFPLFLRKERAELQLTKLKQQDTELANQQKLLELQNKLRNYYNEQLALKKQLDLYTDAVDNYNALLNGEKKKFVTGESSLFLVNSREVRFIEAKLKLAEIKSKYNIARIGMIWASGTLYSI